MSSDSRRKLLKSIATGSGAIIAGKSLPESWRRPVVDSVMLPAHALTSPGLIYSENNFLIQGTLDTQSDSMLAGLINKCIPIANAQPDLADIFDGCATIMGDNVEVHIQRVDFGDQQTTDFKGSLPLDGSASLLTITSPCAPVIATLSASVVSHNNNEIVLNFDGDDIPIQVAPDCVTFTPVICPPP